MSWEFFSSVIRRIGQITMILACVWPTPVGAEAGSPAPSVQRETSTPYTGDLSSGQLVFSRCSLELLHILDIAARIELL